MKVLLTGAAGFIGANLANYLSGKGFDIICIGQDISKRSPGLPGLKIDAPWSAVPWNEIGHVDILIHHAAVTDTSCTDSNKMIKENVSDAVSLFKAALHNSCSRIIYASSMQVYGNAPVPFKEDTPLRPLNLYAESKKILEVEANKLVNRHQDAVIIGLRYGNVFGPGENHKGKMASMVTRIGKQVLSKNLILYKYGEQERDFIYIADVLDAIHASMQITESAVVNIGTGKGTSFNRVVELFNTEFGTDVKPVYVDNPFKDNYQDNVILDISRAVKLLGFNPKISIEKGIHRYVESGVLRPVLR